MRYTTLLLAGTIFSISGQAFAQAQTPLNPNPTAPDKAAGTPITRTPEAGAGDIVVTARRREESLKNVPIAVTALTGQELKDKQVNLVKDIAAYTPGLNINSDSVGRAFVSIRGVGTTLIDTVQPGVGIFIDGIYEPNTSYLNSPIVDVARIEVLRGPQGTLFGNNTLGGAINVITRQPSNSWTGRIDGAYAGTDEYRSLSGSISGPIIPDRLQFRVGAAYHKQNGFRRNTLDVGYQDPLETRSINGTLRVLPAEGAVITLNGSYDRVFGGNTAYLGVVGPTDYSLTGASNQRSVATLEYYGANLKGEFDVKPLNTKITAVASYNERDGRTSGDGDFGPVDFIRSRGTTTLKTRTGEVRFDTNWSPSISTLIGVFASRATNDQNATNTLVPLKLTLPSASLGVFKSQAVFGTIFFKIDPSLDLAVGARLDHQTVNATSAKTAPTYRQTKFQPRITLTKRWNSDLMTYASIAKGVRGGGQNGPGAPNLIYKGDNVWTYEVGAKFNTADNRLSVNAALFYNDYKNFIGQNSLAPNTSGVGFVAINLNTGTVKSYGAEVESHLRITDYWRVDATLTLLHARITDDSQYFATTGVHISTDRLIFTPDYNYSFGTNYKVPIGANALILDASIVGKGNRIGATLDPNVAPRLSAYRLVNGSVTYRMGNGFEIGAFTTNLFNAKYLESYIDRSALVRAGLGAIAQNLAIQGDRRRYGIRASYRF
ncbi:MAG: TonB-dependent receptor [Sphingomicrobium sp.]